MSIGRNDPCPCGSGKKYKKCCMQKSQIKPASQRLKNVKRIEVSKGLGSLFNKSHLPQEPKKTDVEKPQDDEGKKS